MFRANDKEYDTLVSENRFITDVQVAIERAMDEKHMTQAQLARSLNISEARVSQILSGNGKNLQARTIARIAHVLGLQAAIDFKDYNWTCQKVDFSKWTKLRSTNVEQGWNVIANENEIEWAKAA
jgi:transcriptional regulator with XRE-family HTH domain